MTLKTLGLRIQLGHALGEQCLNPAHMFNNDFVVIDVDGIHHVSLDFCGCHTAVRRDIQLLRARLYPATGKYPKTAATFRVLEEFHMLSFMSKISGFEFIQALTRRSDNTGVSPPPVSHLLSSIMAPANLDNSISMLPLWEWFANGVT